jgi:hypothetical protein
MEAHYVEALNASRRELGALDERAKLLRAAIRALETLTGPGGTVRSSRSRSGDSLPDRIKQAMMTRPSAMWSVMDLESHLNANSSEPTVTRQALKGSLARMKDRKVVRQENNNCYTLLTATV